MTPHPTKGITRPATQDKALNLYFEIEKHFCLGGGPLTIREIGQMLEPKAYNTCTPMYYVNILKRWKLVEKSAFSARTIVLVPRNYPLVEWRKIE
jgi:hypothetical protein